ncbi:MAG: efflux RND transporter periplasmic adaptor subunit [Myxococcales bacterium]
MSDRVIVSLAAIPMISGAVLLVAFQRAPALHAAAPKGQRAAAVAGQDQKHSTTWVGVISAGNTAELAAEADGKVTEVWLEAGARVKADQQILQIDSSDAAGALGMASAELGQRSSEIARASARLEEARAKLGRLKAGGKWIADHEIAQAAAEARMAEAEYRGAQAAAQMGRAKVHMQKNREARYRLRAPFDGTLVTCDVDPGDSVRAGQVLARVISDDRQVRFALPPDQAPQEGEFEVLVRDPLSDRSMITKIKTVKPEIDTSAQLVFATAVLALDQNQLKTWLPGTRVEVSPSNQASAIMHNEQFAPVAAGATDKPSVPALPRER